MPNKFVLDSDEGYTIELFNLPEGVTPELIPMDQAEKESLKNLKTDCNIGLITSIAANLVFYDEKRNEVNYFSSPVELVYNFGRQDEARRKERRQQLIESKKLRKNEKVQLIPVYLYSYYPEKPMKDEKKKPEFEVWQPFQNYTINDEKRTVTVKFMFWGDEPTGWGTRP